MPSIEVEEDVQGLGSTVHLSRLIEPGSSPQEVAEQYFIACTARDTKLFLATLHLELRADANSSYPGPFHTCNWELGRARVEKYRVSYKLVREDDKGGHLDAPVSLHYTPLYGPVPGYDEGEALGPVVILTIKKDEGEWRVAKGEF